MALTCSKVSHNIEPYSFILAGCFIKVNVTWTVIITIKQNNPPVKEDLNQKTEMWYFCRGMSVHYAELHKQYTFFSLDLDLFLNSF